MGMIVTYFIVLSGRLNKAMHVKGSAQSLAHISAQYVIIINVIGRICSALSHAISGLLMEASGREGITVPILKDDLNLSK